MKYKSMDKKKCSVIGRNCLRALFILSFFHFFISLTSCSEDSEDESEYANWEERNEAMIAKWAADGSMTKYLTFSKNPQISGTNKDCIYVEKLEAGVDGDSPLYSDSVRIAYRGHLIPSKSYPSGYVFDENFYGDFNWRTINATDFCCSGLVDGFSTAVMHMKVGDHWRVHVPYTLGYGTGSTSSIPGYSDLIFEVALIDFWHPGEKHPKFK